MNTIDPKLVSLARSMRPDLARRVVVTKASQAGRGLLIRSANGQEMPANPPLPSTPDATAAKAAIMQYFADGSARVSGEAAAEAYAEAGA